jgi:hypothetical protein
MADFFPQSNWDGGVIRIPGPDRLPPAEFQTLLSMLETNTGYVQLYIAAPFDTGEYAGMAAVIRASFAQNPRKRFPNGRWGRRNGVCVTLAEHALPDPAALLPLVPLLNLLMLQHTQLGPTEQLVAALRASPKFDTLFITGERRLLVFAAEVLRNNPTLQSFGLAPLGEPMDLAFVDLLSQPDIKIRRLYLNNCAITSTGPVVDIMNRQRDIEELYLIDNAITDDHVVLLAASARPALGVIMLKRNKIARLNITALMMIANNRFTAGLIDYTGNPIEAVEVTPLGSTEDAALKAGTWGGAATQAQVLAQLRAAMAKREAAGRPLRLLGLEAVGL